MIQSESTSLYTNSQACLELNLRTFGFFRKMPNRKGNFLSKDGFFGGQLERLRSRLVHHFAREPIMQRAKMRGE